MSSSVIKSNILQPVQDVNVKNQNLLKLNVTSARADSTDGDENSQIKIKGKPGRKPKNAKKDQKLEIPGPLKIIKHHHSVKKFQTPSVSRRNARERNRVKQVNGGFAILKNHVPNLKNKTSKVDTLRAAVAYIKSLRELIGDPLDENNLHTGPVLITELEDHPSNKANKSSSENVSSTTPNMEHSPAPSTQSSPEMNPMIYQLPTPSGPHLNYGYVAAPSPTSSTSGSSDIDSTQEFNPTIYNLPHIGVFKNSSTEWTSIEGILKSEHFH